MKQTKKLKKLIKPVILCLLTVCLAVILTGTVSAGDITVNTTGIPFEVGTTVKVPVEITGCADMTVLSVYLPVADDTDKTIAVSAESLAIDGVVTNPSTEKFTWADPEHRKTYSEKFSSDTMIIYLDVTPKTENPIQITPSVVPAGTSEKVGRDFTYIVEYPITGGVLSPVVTPSPTITHTATPTVTVTGTPNPTTTHTATPTVTVTGTPNPTSTKSSSGGGGVITTPQSNFNEGGSLNAKGEYYAQQYTDILKITYPQGSKGVVYLKDSPSGITGVSGHTTHEIIKITPPDIVTKGTQRLDIYIPESELNSKGLSVLDISIFVKTTENGEWIQLDTAYIGSKDGNAYYYAQYDGSIRYVDIVFFENGAVDESPDIIEPVETLIPVATPSDKGHQEEQPNPNDTSNPFTDTIADIINWITTAPGIYIAGTTAGAAAAVIIVFPIILPKVVLNFNGRVIKFRTLTGKVSKAAIMKHAPDLPTDGWYSNEEQTKPWNSDKRIRRKTVLWYRR